MKILHIDSSSNLLENSHSRQLSAELVTQLLHANPEAKVDRLDVHKAQLAHIGTNIIEAWAPDGERDSALEALASRSKALVEQLKSADVLVIGSPMYNFSVPSTLKAWIDHVAIARQTFKYTDDGPVGLLEGKKAFIVLSSGGVYSKGPAASAEHLESYLRAVLAFMGITDVATVRAEGMASGPENAENAMQAARARIGELAKA